MVGWEEDDNQTRSLRLGVCIKKKDGTVLSQNPSCIELCGNRIGSTCSDGCMKLITRDKNGQVSPRIQTFKPHLIGNEDVEISVAYDGDEIVTLLVHVRHDIERTLESYRQFRLSRRELEIMGHVLRGETNRTISMELGISLSTVKKHLFSIYGKLPASHAFELKRFGRT